MTTSLVLSQLLAAQGRTVRSGQAAAATHIDSGAQHVAAMCPTGVGKSALAIAVSVARKGGTIAVNSNGLVSQYVAEIPEWEKALGVKVAALVGRAHYWCPLASPELVGFTPEQRSFVQATGSFIGSGVEKARYESHSVVALSPVPDDEEADMKVSPCTKCAVKATGNCPLWQARATAAAADVVITNATVLGMSIAGATDWAKAIRRPVIVLDEADSCGAPIAKVLGGQITVKGAVDGKDALASVRKWAADDQHKRATKARKFLFQKRVAEEEGRSMVVSSDEGKIVLTIPVDLTKVFADKHVVAMSATLSQRNVQDLGLAAKVANFQGLDVSASTVTVQDDAPAWQYGGKSGPPADWVAHVANELTEAFRAGGRTLGLFQSNLDLDAVMVALPADVRSAVLKYSSKTDRPTVVATYTANPDKHLLVGLVQGAGRGLNLPGELLRRVIVSRVPQAAPRDADREVWMEDSRASITQSVGRAHRHADDYGHVTIVGGFGRRTDVAKALTDLGWKIA